MKFKTVAHAIEEWLTDPIGYLREALREFRRITLADWLYGLAIGLAVLLVALLASH